MTPHNDNSKEKEYSKSSKRAMTYSKTSKRAMTYSKSSKREEREEVFKIQQEREKDLLKIQQEREREMEEDLLALSAHRRAHKKRQKRRKRLRELEYIDGLLEMCEREAQKFVSRTIRETTTDTNTSGGNHGRSIVSSSHNKIKKKKMKKSSNHIDDVITTTINGEKDDARRDTNETPPSSSSSRAQEKYRVVEGPFYVRRGGEGRNGSGVGVGDDAPAGGETSFGLGDTYHIDWRAVSRVFPEFDPSATLTDVRVRRKRTQVAVFASVIAALRCVLAEGARIVDFGCGSGNMLLTLAFLFPEYAFVAVDIKSTSIELLVDRAKRAGLRNLSATFVGAITDFRDDFQLGLGLHVCGSGTDDILRTCAQQGAHFIISSCCIGKITETEKNFKVLLSAAGANDDGHAFSDADFAKLVSVADFGERLKTSTHRQDDATLHGGGGNEMTTAGDETGLLTPSKEKRARIDGGERFRSIRMAAKDNFAEEITDAYDSFSNAVHYDLGRRAKLLLEIDRILGYQYASSANAALASLLMTVEDDDFASMNKKDILVGVLPPDDDEDARRALHESLVSLIR